MIYMYRKQCFLLSIHLIKGWWTQQHAYIYGTVYLAWIKDKSRRTWLVSLYRKAKRLAPNIILVSENLLNIQSKLAVHCLVNKCSRGILSLLESLHPYRTDTLRFVLATLEFEYPVLQTYTCIPHACAGDATLTAAFFIYSSSCNLHISAIKLA
jgi:hypothetical protein